MIKLKMSKLQAEAFTSLLIGFFLFLDHFRYFFPQGYGYYFINVFGLFIILFMLFFFPNYRKPNLFFLNSYLVVMTIFYIASSLYKNDLYFRTLIYLYQGVILASTMLRNKLNHKIVRSYLLFFIIWYSFKIIIGTPRSSFFPNVSQNGITVYLLIVAILYFVSSHQNMVKVNITYFLLVLMIATWAAGRSGVIAATLLVAIVAFENSLVQRNNKRKVSLNKTIIIMVLVIIIFILWTNLDIKNFVFGVTLDRFKKVGLFESGRSKIWREYLYNILNNALNLLFGVPESQLPILKSYNNNPHNSFIRFHLNVGFFVFLLLLLLGFTLLKLVKNNISYAGVLLLILIRVNTDVVALPGPFDFLIYYFIFSTIKPRPTLRVKSIKWSNTANTYL